MTDFIIKSSISMLAFLAVYKLFLEREKMHHFNRFYLLASLIISLVIPFLSFTIYKEVVTNVAPPVPLQENINLIAATAKNEEPIDYTMPVLCSVYGMITLILCIRFFNNIRHFNKQIRQNSSVVHENASLILVDDCVIPHTFLNYIFVNKEEFERNSIENELYTHELTHVRQKHTIDILFIEVLKTIFWFNPLLYIYKKAIQLNHEFLADESVINHSHNITFYQKLLLQKAVPATNYILASSLNFSVTKKRFKMMTKATPKAKATVLKLAALPLIAGLLYALCIEVVAQTVIVNPIEAIALPEQNAIKHGEKDPVRDSYYAGVHVVIHDGKDKIINKPYEQLTEAEKDKYLAPVPKPAEKRALSDKLFESLKDKKTYSVAIDNEHVDNSKLNSYKPEDFAVYTSSPAFTDAVTGKQALSQYMLYTNNYYDTNVKDAHKKYKHSTYVVSIGIYSDPAAAQSPNPTPESKVTHVTADTVKKTKEQKMAETRRVVAMAERDRAMAEREKMIAKRNALSAQRDTVKDNPELEQRRAEIEKKRAAMDQKRQELLAKKKGLDTRKDSIHKNKSARLEERHEALEKRKQQMEAKKALFKEPKVYQENKIYSAGEVEKEPEYPGGATAFYSYVKDKLKTPSDFKEKSAKVYASFIVEKDGTISTVEILRQPDGVDLKDAVAKVLKKSKKWSPATVENKAVRCSYVMPILVEDQK
ncbi:hypothetical protein GR160_16705 [Flavobacterium sp. Sd200]|uniref:M56 family metallopeptidase n=1 Tax=Flavobacterium sp. Sd200 TaxID=2692211 RepID=UPI00136FDF1A|nr:M56 family metallopeptidase [Flavobacterium sp. Sd200]MXN92870.1 hypothetical protein [Flavobacterium sp. Sd200]